VSYSRRKTRVGTQAGGPNCELGTRLTLGIVPVVVKSTTGLEK